MPRIKKLKAQRITPKDVLVFRGLDPEQIREAAEKMKAATGCSLVIALALDASLDAIRTIDENHMRDLGWVKADRIQQIVDDFHGLPKARKRAVNPHAQVERLQELLHP